MPFLTSLIDSQWNDVTYDHELGLFIFYLVAFCVPFWTSFFSKTPALTLIMLAFCTLQIILRLARRTIAQDTYGPVKKSFGALRTEWDSCVQVWSNFKQLIVDLWHFLRHYLVLAIFVRFWVVRVREVGSKNVLDQIYEDDTAMAGYRQGFSMINIFLIAINVMELADGLKICKQFEPYMVLFEACMRDILPFVEFFTVCLLFLNHTITALGVIYTNAPDGMPYEALSHP